MIAFYQQFYICQVVRIFNQHITTVNNLRENINMMISNGYGWKTVADIAAYFIIFDHNPLSNNKKLGPRFFITELFESKSEIDLICELSWRLGKIYPIILELYGWSI